MVSTESLSWAFPVLRWTVYRNRMVRGFLNLAAPFCLFDQYSPWTGSPLDCWSKEITGTIAQYCTGDWTTFPGPSHQFSPQITSLTAQYCAINWTIFLRFKSCMAIYRTWMYLLIRLQVLSQCRRSKCIEFGTGSRLLAQFGSLVIPSILDQKIYHFREKNLTF